MYPPKETSVVAVAEDPFVRRYMRCLLERRGYQVIESDAGNVRRLLESGEVKIDLVISNTPSVFSPFARQLPLVYLSAAPDPDLVSGFSCQRTLQKPFQPAEVLSAVQELLTPVQQAAAAL